MWLRLSVLLLAATASLAAQNLKSLPPEELAKLEAQNAALGAMVKGMAPLPFERAAIPVTPPQPDGWALGMVSWVAADKNGLTYLLQRGDKADPVIVLDRTGKVLRSWGKGMYSTPHAIRIDPRGNVWTTDAASSMVYKFSPEGKTLLQIEVGGQPSPCNNFCSTTDVAFAPNGNVFIADGYRNARILEYSPDGKKLREWGSAGTGPGQFRLPHSIQVDDKGVVYVADRENGRIQWFDPQGKFLGEWSQYGKTFGMKLVGPAMWLSTIPRGPNSTPGWLIKVDRASGKLLGYVDALGNHGMDVMPNGDLVQAPGPDQIPQVYRARTAAPSTLVPVDVRVVDERGEPISNLTAADFTLLEDGKPQTIAHFAGRTAPRTFMIVLGRGQLNTPVKGLDALIDFVSSRLMPDDRVGVIAYFRAAQPTTDHRAVARFLTRFRERHIALDQLLDPIGGPVFRSITPESKAALDLLFHGELAFGELPEPRADRTATYNNVRYLHSAIEYVNGMDGEKHVIALIAEAFPATSSMRKPTESYVGAAAISARATLNFLATGGVTPHQVMKHGRFDVVPTGHAYLHAGGQRRLAELTGGTAAAYRDATETLSRLDRSTRFQYVLGYHPATIAQGNQHPDITVTVRHPGATLMYRRSY